MTDPNYLPTGIQDRQTTLLEDAAREAPVSPDVKHRRRNNRWMIACLPRRTFLYVFAGFTLASIAAFAFAGYVDAHGRRNYANGVCLALDIAFAHGALDETQRRRVIWSIARDLPPNKYVVPLKYYEIEVACNVVRTAGAFAED